MRSRPILLLLCLIPLVLMGCGDEESTDCPTCPTTTQYFTLDFDVNGGEDRAVTFDVAFISGITSVVPTVTIDGVEMDNWQAGDMGILYGQMRNLAYVDTVTFSVSAEGKTSSGSLPLPGPIEVMTCNGDTLVSDTTTDIDPADSYLFEWDCAAFDYFNIYWDASNHEYDSVGSNDTWQTLQYFTVNDYPGLYRIYCRISAESGPRIEAGSEPNFSGDYGRGWVSGRSSDYYYVRIMSPVAGAARTGKIESAPGGGQQSLIARAELLKSLIEGLN